MVASRWLRLRARTEEWNASENASSRNSTAAAVPAVATCRERAASAPNCASARSSCRVSSA